MRRLPRILRIVAAAVSLVISLSLFCGSGVALKKEEEVLEEIQWIMDRFRKKWVDHTFHSLEMLI